MAAPQSALSRARALASGGRADKVLSAYKKAVAADPNNADLLVEAGVTLAEHGVVDQARTLLERAAALRPGDVAIRLNLGEVCRLAGELDQALENYNAVVAQSPSDADGHYGIGETLIALGRPDEAIAPLQRAHDLAPRDAEILNALGLAQARTDDCAGAVETLKKAITLKPRYFDAWANIAYALASADYWREAALAYQQAAKFGKLNGLQLTKWALTLANLREYDEALQKIANALSLEPEHGRAHSVHGVVLQYFGKFDEAEAAFRKAIECDPSLSEAYEHLARMRRLSVDEAAAMEQTLKDGTAQTGHRIAAGFALSRVYDQAGDYDRAFSALATANRLKSAEVPFDAKAQEKLVDQLIDIFTTDFFARHAGEGLPDTTPMFVLGLPRSGTTLTETVLAADPGVHAGGERGDFQDLIQKLPNYPDMVRDVGPDWAGERAGEVLAALKVAGGSAKHVTNKMPGNYLCLGLIHWFFPNAKIIHTKRDPLDLGLSCYEQNFRRGLSFTYDLEAFAFTYKQYRRLMAHWHAVLPGVVLDVQYEDLVTNPATVARDIVAFCGFEWSDAFVETHRVERAVDTASFWQVRQPINTKSVAKWRRYEKQLSPLIAALEAE